MHSDGIVKHCSALQRISQELLGCGIAPNPEPLRWSCIELQWRSYAKNRDNTAKAMLYEAAALDRSASRAKALPTSALLAKPRQSYVSLATPRDRIASSSFATCCEAAEMQFLEAHCKAEAKNIIALHCRCSARHGRAKEKQSRDTHCKAAEE